MKLFIQYSFFYYFFKLQIKFSQKKKIIKKKQNTKFFEKLINEISVSNLCSAKKFNINLI